MSLIISSMRTKSLWLAAMWLAVALAARSSDAERPADTVSFDHDIRPILSENCYACHGFDAESREADLRLDVRQPALDAGNVIVPGDADASLLVARILSDDENELMPPPDSGRELTQEQIEKLRKWIAQGAIYEEHWAFVPPVSTDPPTFPGVSHPIDRLIQSRLATEGLRPSPAADLTTLIRRVSLDLIGLPPTPTEIDDFQTAAAINVDAAYTELVDRLLASPHYGERWGRWWLDQARYADSNGYSIDGPREIWKYRDWVVNALNRDMPFDQFTIEQLAGDLLPDATVEQRVATGFHRNTQINQEGGIDREQFRIDSIFDRVATTGTVWLGLSIGCAQCHDHKFDPVSQKEFYQMFAFLNNQDEPSIKVYPDEVDAPELMTEQKRVTAQLNDIIKEHQAALDQWEQQLSTDAQANLDSDVKKILELDAKKRKPTDHLRLLVVSGLLPDSALVNSLQKREAEISRQLARGVSTMVLAERSKPRQSTVFIKGDFTRADEEVMPGTPSVLHPLVAERALPNRLDLAHWIVAPENPLTTRVIVNRVWQQYFGRGLVETDSDFGLQGSLPSHPRLLDWLAVKFRENHWSLQDLHRLIVTSHTYRQSSRAREDLIASDPLNHLLGRQNRLRLDAEIVRDVALVASGLFSPELGGPPVYPPIPEGVMALGQVRRRWNVSKGGDRYRRGLYTFVYRATPPPSLNVFDAPDGQSSCTRRIRSNTPLQALTLLNDAAFFEFAQALQQRIEAEGIRTTFQRCTSREPTDEEVELLSQLDPLGAARALLNLDETINRE